MISVAFVELAQPVWQNAGLLLGLKRRVLKEDYFFHYESPFLVHLCKNNFYNLALNFSCQFL